MPADRDPNIGKFIKGSGGGASVATLAVRLTGQATGYQKMLDSAVRASNRAAAKIKNTVRQIQAMGGALRSVGQSIQSVGAKLTAFATVPIAGMGVGLVKVAADAVESQSKFETVFSSIGSKAEEMADRLDKSYGLSGVGARRMLADTGDLLSGFGFSQESALELSTQVQALAVDLASFTNVQGGATRASEALTKGLLGEREMMKQLGIAILEEDVKAQVALNTSRGLTFESERQAKAHATLQLAVKQSKNAIGDYARTSGSFANQFRELRADIEDMAAELGSVLIPVAQKVVDVLRRAINWVRGTSDQFKKWALIVAGVVAALGPLLLIIGTVVSAIGLMIIGAAGLASALVAVITPTNAVIAAVVLLGATMLAWFNKNGELLSWFSRQWNKLVGVVAPAIKAIGDALLSGDIQLAVAILWMEIDVAWKTGINILMKEWLNFKLWFKQNTLDIAEQLRTGFENATLKAIDIALKLRAKITGEDINTEGLMKFAKMGLKAEQEARREVFQIAKDQMFKDFQKDTNKLQEEIDKLHKNRDFFRKKAADQREKFKFGFDVDEQKAPQIELPKIDQVGIPKVDAGAIGKVAKSQLKSREAVGRGLEASARIAEFRDVQERAKDDKTDSKNLDMIRQKMERLVELEEEAKDKPDLAGISTSIGLA